jgi:outer membrane murein-binding lipoprotein Lpp
MRRLAGLLTMICLFASCVAHGTTAGRDADASIAAVRADVREINAAMVQLKTDIRAGRDVNTNDKWTLRLLGLGVMLLGLSYPIGKMLWLAPGAIQRRARWVVLAASRARTDQVRPL